MILSDLHVHTSFCDGENSPEEIVRFAAERGMRYIGFSAHSNTPFDESYCIKKCAVNSYIDEINRLKNKYKDKIHILCGMEADYFSPVCKKKFDYLIGSVHYVLKNGKYLPIDESPQIFAEIVSGAYGGNVFALIEDYFNLAANVLEKTSADIIGHFDLISKFNEGNAFFDEKSEKYGGIWKKAAERLAAFGKPFEINTGAISRGYRSEAYPSVDMLKFIKSLGGSFILSSDSHKKESLMFKFDEYEALSKRIGLSFVNVENLIGKSEA